MRFDEGRYTLLLAALIAGAMAAPYVALAQPTRALELKTEYVIPLPPGITVTGAHIASTGRIVFWDAINRRVFVHEMGRTRPACTRRSLSIAAGGVAKDGSFALLERVRGRVFALAPDGSCPLRSEGAGHVYQASDLDDGWLFSTGALLSSGSVVRTSTKIDTTGYTIVVDSAPIMELHLSAANGGGILTHVHSPYEWTLSRPATADLTGRPFQRDTVLHAGGTAVNSSLLLSLATRPLDVGYLQVLADPRSDLRVMVVYDSHGKRTRISSVNAALGVLATHPGTRRLVMVLQTDRSQLIVYRWRWLVST